MRTSTGPTASVRLLVASCHPLPTLAVTAFTAGLALSIGVPATTALVILLAVLCGQLSIGWSNDLLDANRDATAGRTDKPLSRAPESVRMVSVACGVALAACVALSLAVGVRPGVCHLIAVGAAWSYNVWLKASWWSWLPFAIAFGLLPVFVYGGLPGQPLPPAWAIACAALLGVGAHLVNAAPDAADDQHAGIRGAAVRWGAQNAVAVAFACFGLAAAVAAFGADGGAEVAQVVLWGVAIILVVASAFVAFAASRDTPVPRWLFRAVLALIAAEVALILIAA